MTGRYITFLVKKFDYRQVSPFKKKLLSVSNFLTRAMFYMEAYSISSGSKFFGLTSGGGHKGALQFLAVTLMIG